MLRSINPFNLEVLAEYPLQSSAEISDLVHQARRAHIEWRQRTVEERAICMQLLAHLLRELMPTAAERISLEMGKPLQQAQAEVLKCAQCCEYVAHEAPAQLEALSIASEYRSSRVHFQPLGLVLGIMPWNFPFWQVIRAAVPALMAGNTVMIKHSPEVSGCALLLQDAFNRAGMGEGVYSTVFASHEQISELIAHPSVAALTLTGSTRAGRSVAAQAGHNLKKTVLELGGSDAYCVLDDADISLAARVCATSRLINSGQSCVAAKRFIVMESVRVHFEEALRAEMQKAVVGDPFDASTTVGPLARLDLRDGLHAQVERSIQQGARVILDGGTGAGAVGAVFQPMILSDVQPGMAAFDEELFGPVAAVISAQSQTELIDLANRSIYGLGAAVFSADVERAEDVAMSLEAGCVFVNDFVKSDPRFPFGGVKASGWGRELSVFGMREFVNVKSLLVA